MILAGYGALVAAYLLPTDRISAKVQQSYTVFQTEGSYRQLIPGKTGTTQDNFTDGLILLIAENKGKESAWQEALLGRNLNAPEHNPAQALVSYHSGEKLKYGEGTYARYWHGYLSYVKPLLSLFSYQHIRYLLLLVQTALLLATVYLMGEKGKRESILPLFTAVFLLNPAVCSVSLQFTPVFVITFAELIVLLLYEERYRARPELWIYHFFFVGALTVYFDFLTYPLVTFGLPIAYLMTQYKGSVRTGAVQAALSGVAWAMGYGLMWASKWVLASVITNQNVIANAWRAIQYRSGFSQGEVAFNLFHVIGRNMAACRWGLVVSLAIFLVCLCIGIIRKRARWQPKMLLMIGVAALPFLWYAVASNHSWVHPWMAYRELAIFVYALVSIGVMLLEKRQ